MRRLLQRMRAVKDLLEHAEQEALAVGLDEPDAEHLLLAALEAPDGTAPATFRAVGVEPQAVRAAIEGVHRDALAALGVAGGVPADEPADEPGGASPTNRLYESSATAKDVFQRAGALARARPGGRLTGADVVTAVCDLQAGTVPRALADLGVDVDRLRVAALAAARAGGG